MATFLITYSDLPRAKEAGLPPAGTPVEISNLADMDSLMERTGVFALIVHPKHRKDQAPEWATVLVLIEPQRKIDDHLVESLPEDWQQLRWILIFTGTPKAPE
jgi:hypothetical protein